MPPLLFGLGIAVDHSIGSKWLINELARLGFCISYSEVQHYKQSAMVDTDSGKNSAYENSMFCQFVADNVDHNINTLDGKETFHGMGVIACSINSGEEYHGRIKRLAKNMKSDDLVKNRGIKIHWYSQPDFQAISKIVFSPIQHLKMPLTIAAELNTDILWHSAGIFTKSERVGPRPNWNGYMHLITSYQSKPQSSTITMLPIINVNPSDMSYIYSTLLFVKDQSHKLNINNSLCNI